ncbi:MAG TPA: nitrate reductase [Nitrospiraceae bacterium]|nr:nitrate reductase [Nitrospiraceae bacterium]
MNVSSAVVKTRPEHVQDVLNALRAVDHCETPFHDDQGRIVVTIEGETISEEMQTLRTIQAIPHVLSAELAYSYSESELAEAVRRMDQTGNIVPDALKDE